VEHDVYDTVIGLVEVDDSHMGISIGVDPHGRVHVSANTHDDFIRHIQTTEPHDISEWEEAPLIEKQAKHFTNVVENGVVENNLDGWFNPVPSQFTMDRVTHSYGWGSTTGNDTNCKAVRITRTGVSLNQNIGIGVALSISGNGFPVTAGEMYNCSLSFRTLMVSAADIQHSFQIVWRNGETELSRTDSDTRLVASADRNKWYRCVARGEAPATADNCVIVFITARQSGNATEGDAMWVDGLMLYEGDEAGDIVYRDGSFNLGFERTGWVWNGTPYASTSTGPIRAEGYAGINTCTYNRFQAFSDGTLIMSMAQPQYPNDPVGRCWSAWKMTPEDTEFQPLVDGSSGNIMQNTASYLLQGSTYPILSTGNPANDDFIADRAYAFATWIDKNDVLHIFCWFRVKTNTSNGSLLYIRSTDKGNTFTNINGEPVTMPLTYPASLDECLVTTDGETPMNFSTMGGVAEKDGNPIFLGNRTGDGMNLVWWNGTAWETENIDSYGFTDKPSIAYVRGDLWLFGVKTVSGSTMGLWGVNHTQDSGLILRLGAASVGTPDGEYDFESGATYENAPTHAGGLDSAGNYVYRRLLPDDDSPKIVSFGDGVRGGSV
jgi:hypothetical protein